MSGLRIKLCGVRRVEDALLCAEAGADEIGIIFARTSKRRLSLPEARAIRNALPARIALVGVFLDATLAELEEAVRGVPLSALQLHGALPAELAGSSGAGLPLALPPRVPLIRALHVESREMLRAQGGLPRFARVLLDGPRGGGSGQAFDWRLLAEARALFAQPLFLAGGLTPENVAEAVGAARPDGVDVASGIEGPDGFKDAGRVRSFVAAARAATALQEGSNTPWS